MKPTQARRATTKPQNVKNATSRRPSKHASQPGSRPNSNGFRRPGPRVERTTFKTSREMDFFSQRELVTQTGHEVEEWPLVFLKEANDNGLDACEEAEIAPVIEVSADECGITVRDNGPGLPEATLEAALDFTVRASNREAYVAPDRGAQGNALKTLLPMPVVLDPEHGSLIVQAHDKRHVITCRADPISQQAAIHRDVTEMPTAGTELRIQWAPRRDSADYVVLWPFDNLDVLHPDTTWQVPFADRFRGMLEGFALFNPHATITLDWFGTTTTWEATNPAWDKWKPCKPSSAHWYELRHFERLIGAYITHDRSSGTDRLASDVIAKFDGLTGSTKRAAVLNETDLRRVNLSEFVVDGRLDSARIAALLASMQKHTRPVKSMRLGIIGEPHLRARLLAMGVQEKSFRYTRKLSKTGLPTVLEMAFGYLGKDAQDRRRIYTGANWSAAIKNPFRSFGATGAGLDHALSELKVGPHEPVVVVVHLAHPRIEYTDRGKSALVMGGCENDYQPD